ASFGLVESLNVAQRIVLPMPQMPRGSAVVIIAILGIVIVAAISFNSFAPRSSPSGNSPGGNPPGGNPPPVIGPQCRGTAACFTDTVTYIVEGDTLDVGSTRIRLTLVNSPEDRKSVV